MTALFTAARTCFPFNPGAERLSGTFNDKTAAKSAAAGL